MKRVPSRRGFTLIELLVVVAIIAILASLLLPALKSARDRAKQAACLAQIRQVSVCVLMLAQDNDDWLDAAHIGTNYWTSAMAAYMGKDLADALYPSVHAAGKKHCPSFRPGPGFTAGVFGINSALVDTLFGVYPPHSLREIRNRSATHLLAENWAPSTDRGPGGLDATCVGSSPGFPQYYPRHEGRGLNFVFLDGRAEFVPYVDSYLVKPSLWGRDPQALTPPWTGYGSHKIWGP